MSTKLPGLKGGHQIITDNCREIHSDLGAFDEAVERLREQFKKTLLGWKSKGIKFHVVYTIEEPEKGEKK